MKGTVHIALRNECQLDYEIPGEFRQYYPTNQSELYRVKYPNPLKSFMSTVPSHTVSNLFRLCTSHGVLSKYFQMRCISEQNHYCECRLLETIKYVFKKCRSVGCKEHLLRKVSPESDLKTFRDTKNSLGAVIKSS